MTATISLTELRQRLFQLADRVVENGEPILIERRGVRLRLVRDEPVARAQGRLARLKPQSLVIGAPLDPHESPAQWNETAHPARVAEPAASMPPSAPRDTRRPRR